MKDLATYTQEEIQVIVDLFKEYGVGISLPDIVSQATSKHVLWHELVHPNKNTGTFFRQASEIRSAIDFFVARAQVAVSQTLPEDEAEYQPKSIASYVYDYTGKKISITWEQMAIFAYAAFRERKKADKYKDLIKQIKKDQDFIDSKTPDSEKVKQAQDRLDKIKKELEIL